MTLSITAVECLTPPAETPTHRHPTIDAVVRAVASAHGLTREQMLAPTRRAEIAHPRQVAMHIARAITAHSTPVIAKHMGLGDHTTILYGSRAVAARRATDPALDALIVRIEMELGR